MNKVINIDWLQLNCKGQLSLHAGFTYKLLPYSTRVFRKIYEMYQADRLLCTIACCPLSSAIPQDTNIIKFENRILYEPDLWSVVDCVIKVSNLKFKGVSRLDVCCDFNYFDNNLRGDTFIANFLNNSYFHHCKSKYSVHGRQKYYNINDYLRFGSGNSIVVSYLYNKTLEMHEVKHKHHIYNCWLENKLDVSKDVFRLEFSIKSSQISITDYQSKEKLELNTSNLRSYDFLQELFYSLYERYFTFSYRATGSKKDDLKRVPLFNRVRNTYINKIFSNTKDFTRTDKTFLRRLEAYNNELRETKRYLADELEQCKEHFIDTRGLRMYYLKKIL
jgi:hypothetical protein